MDDKYDEVQTWLPQLMKLPFNLSRTIAGAALARSPHRLATIGAGPHHCIGNILGRTTISIAIARLLVRFPEAHISDPDFTPIYGGAVGELRLQSLPMAIQ